MVIRTINWYGGTSATFVRVGTWDVQISGETKRLNVIQAASNIADALDFPGVDGYVKPTPANIFNALLHKECEIMYSTVTD